jgi:hypothetical protein
MPDVVKQSGSGDGLTFAVHQVLHDHELERRERNAPGVNHQLASSPIQVHCLSDGKLIGHQFR